MHWLGEVFQCCSTLQHTTASMKMRFDLIVLIQYFRQRWSPRNRFWPKRRPRHNLKSLASKVKSLALASKPPSPQKCLVLGSRTALIFGLLIMGQGHNQFCFVLKNAGELKKDFWRTYFFLEKAWNSRKLYKILEQKTLFFYLDNARIFQKLYEFSERRFFFLVITSALYSWSLALTSCISDLGLERVCPR